MMCHWFVVFSGFKLAIHGFIEFLSLFKSKVEDIVRFVCAWHYSNITNVFPGLFRGVLQHRMGILSATHGGLRQNKTYGSSFHRNIFWWLAMFFTLKFQPQKGGFYTSYWGTPMAVDTCSDDATPRKAKPADARSMGCRRTRLWPSAKRERPGSSRNFQESLGLLAMKGGSGTWSIQYPSIQFLFMVLEIFHLTWDDCGQQLKSTQ